jgi:hypothetical protein
MAISEAFLISLTEKCRSLGVNRFGHFADIRVPRRPAGLIAGSGRFVI